jgi:hypothetical protein
MKWILLTAEAVLIAVGFYCYLANRESSRKMFLLKAVLESVGTEAAKRIAPIRSLPQSLRRRIHILHPEQSENESCADYIREKAIQVYLILLLANTVLLPAAFRMTEVRDIGYSLERPVYGSRDRTETLIARGPEDETEVKIEVPSQEPTAEQAESVLQAAEDELRKEIDAIGTVREDVYLPVRIGDVEVYYRRDAANGTSRVSEDGFIRITEADTEEVILKTELWYRGFRRICTLEIPIDQKEPPTFASTVQEAARSAEVTPSEVILPSSVSVDGKEESVVWQTPESGREIGRYAAIAWILPFALLPLGRIDLRRKEKERLRQITLRFPFMIEKLMVYLGSGLFLAEAWGRIASGAKTDPLTEEVEVTRIQIRNGMPLQEALREFGNRIPNADIRKLSGMLARDLRRGDEYLLDRLTELNQDAWESYRKEVRIRSEETETRMLLPMILLLIVVLLLVMAPAMLTFRG